MNKLNKLIYNQEGQSIFYDTGLPSDFQKHFNTIINSEYVINKVLTSDFKNFCERNLKEIKVNDKVLKKDQLLLFTEFFLGSVTEIDAHKEHYIE